MDEDFEQLVMECQNCHLKFYAKELRVDPQSNVLKCTNCLSFPEGKVHIIREKPLPQKKARIERPKPAISQVLPKKKDEFPNLPPGYTAYRCIGCHYTFKRKGEFKSNCPYCSRREFEVLKKN